MICYASLTGTKRNQAAIRAAGWRMLITRVGQWNPYGFKYALDNGAWSDFQQGQSFDEDQFQRLVDRLGADADWIVAPDIVAGGLESLKFSLRWSNRLTGVCPLILLAVQDGMSEADLAPLVGPRVGIFLGGSTEWKLATMGAWGEFCAARKIHYHVARVNTRQRFNAAHDAGASSIDGSSASRYAKTMPALERWAAQPSLLSPRGK